MVKKILLVPCSLLLLVWGCGHDSVDPRPGRGSEAASVSSFDEADSGGLDAIATTGQKPRIVDLVFQPSKFVAACQKLVVTVTATDPDPARLTYVWTLEAPAGATPTLEPDGRSLGFSSRVPGDFTVSVEVCEPTPAADPVCARLSFPIHVVLGADENHDGIADLCADTCLPACGTLTCGPDPVCGASCGACPPDQICTPLGFCAIPTPH